MPTDLPREIAELASEASPAAALRLKEIGEFGDRDLAKAARKALFHLKQRGITPVSPSPMGANGALHPHDPTAARAIANLSAAMPDGSRFLLIAQSEDAAETTVFRLSDEHGIVSSVKMESTIAEVRRKLHERAAGAPQPASARIPSDYGHHLLESAAALTRAKGRMIPYGCRGALERLGPAQRAYERPLIYDYISEDEAAAVPPRTATAAKFVQSTNAFVDWPTKDELAIWLPRCQAVNSSPIVLSESQKQQRLRQVLVEAVRDIVTDERRARLIARLELDAVVYWHADDREAARMALQLAVSGKRATPREDWPLAYVHAAGPIMAALQEKEQQGEPANGPEHTIIVPGR